MSYRGGNLQQSPLASVQSLKEENLGSGFATDLHCQQCSEFALHRLMYSMYLGCGGHAHLQYLFSWSMSPPEWMAPSSPGLCLGWYPIGDAHTCTQHMNQLKGAPSSAVAVLGQKTPNLVVLLQRSCFFLLIWWCTRYKVGFWMDIFPFIFYIGTPLTSSKLQVILVQYHPCFLNCSKTCSWTNLLISQVPDLVLIRPVWTYVTWRTDETQNLSLEKPWCTDDFYVSIQTGTWIWVFCHGFE